MEGDQRKEHRLGHQNRRQRVTAFGPQCTHLGCAYHWEQGKKQFLCPCHTSVFSIDGKVIIRTRAAARWTGMRPRSKGNKLLLGKLHRRIRRSRNHEAPLDGLNDWLDHRTGIQTAVRTFPLRGHPRVERLAPGLRQRRAVPVPGAGLHRYHCWRSTMRLRRAKRTTACATS